MTYVMTLPRSRTLGRHASGAGGGTWNFQLRPTFWFGLTLCDTESAPEFTKICTPDSDANDLVGTDPAAADYIGKHPGNAYMELQFYGPGYVPQFEGFGCTATQYCAAMTIDSLTLDQNTGDREQQGLQQLHIGWTRADQLGVYHQGRRVPSAREPAVHRHVDESQPQRSQSQSCRRTC